MSIVFINSVTHTADRKKTPNITFSLFPLLNSFTSMLTTKRHILELIYLKLYRFDKNSVANTWGKKIANLFNTLRLCVLPMNNLKKWKTMKISCFKELPTAQEINRQFVMIAKIKIIFSFNENLILLIFITKLYTIKSVFPKKLKQCCQQ